MSAAADNHKRHDHDHEDENAKFRIDGHTASDIATATRTESTTTWLPDALWHQILSYCGPSMLCSTALVNKTFYGWSNQDCFWKIHCDNRWKGKQGISQFRPQQQQQQQKEGSSSLPLKKWKQRYAWAEYDKYRTVIHREEICHYSWKLIYNGVESRMGLRNFSADGTYYSPYAGACEWTLLHNRLYFMGISLPIERNPETWGWTIGKNHSTEYQSIEDEQE